MSSAPVAFAPWVKPISAYGCRETLNDTFIKFG